LIVPAYFGPQYGLDTATNFNRTEGWTVSLKNAATELGSSLIVVASPHVGPGTDAPTTDSGGNPALQLLTPPGAWWQAYRDAIQGVRGENGQVVGFIDLANGTRRAAVQTDIDTWFDWYSPDPGIDGIFFDRASMAWEDYTTSYYDYLDSLYTEVQAKQPGATVVFNFGSIPPDQVKEVTAGPFGDSTVTVTNTPYDYPNLKQAILVTFENTYAEFPTQYRNKLAVQQWVDAEAANNPTGFGALFHTTPAPWIYTSWYFAYTWASTQNIGWVYMTDDVMANPFDTLPDYFAKVVRYVRNRAVRGNWVLMWAKVTAGAVATLGLYRC